MLVTRPHDPFNRDIGRYDVDTVLRRNDEHLLLLDTGNGLNRRGVLRIGLHQELRGILDTNAAGLCDAVVVIVEVNGLVGFNSNLGGGGHYGGGGDGTHFL